MDVKGEGLPEKANAFHGQLTEDREEGGRSFHSAIKGDTQGSVLGDILGGETWKRDGKHSICVWKKEKTPVNRIRTQLMEAGKNFP